MFFFEFIRGVVTRALFLLVALLGIWRVTWVKKSSYYWYLIVLFLPLLVELGMNIQNREAKYQKWISPPILLFLTSIIPSIWILEIDLQRYQRSNPKCLRFDSWESMQHFVNKTTEVYEENEDYVNIFQTVFSSICPSVWILAFHQIILILLIVGKWLLPLAGGITREELSQLLISFVGTAADILEFTSETLSDIKGKSPYLVYIILSVWTWSMLQFPFHLSVVNTSGQNNCDEEVQPLTLCAKHSTDMFSIMEATLTQDGPFLVVRATVIVYYKVFHQMLVFFAIKNILVVALSMYRMYVICRDFNPPEVGQAQTSAAVVEATGDPPAEEFQPPEELPGPSHLANKTGGVQPGSSGTTSQATPHTKTISKAKSDPRPASKVTPDPTSISTAPSDNRTVRKTKSDHKTVSKATEGTRTVTKTKSDSRRISKATADPTTITKAKSDPRTVSKDAQDPSNVPKATPDPTSIKKSKSDPRTVSKTTQDSRTASKAKSGTRKVSKAKPGPSTVSEATPGPSTVSITMPDSSPTSEIREVNG